MIQNDTTKTAICIECNLEKPIEKYGVRAYGKNGNIYLSNECKDCFRKKQMARREESREYVITYLLNHPCVDCGETNVLCLEFDHMEGKTMHLSKMVNCQKSSVETVATEIAKCEVRCANCHNIRTAKHFGYWKIDALERIMKKKNGA